MVAYNNSFEGGVDGDNATNGNSGDASGDAFTSQSVGVNGTMKYDAAAAMHGAMGLSMTTTAATVAMYLEYNVAPADRYTWRAYIRFSSQPNVITMLGRIRADLTNATMANIVMRADNTIGLQDAGNAGISASNGTVAIAANTVYRYEVAINGITGAGGWKLFLGDSTTVLDSKDVTGQNFGSAQVGKIRFGRVTGSTWIGTIHWDDIQLQDLAAGFPGPVSNAAATVRPNGIASNPGVFTNQGGAPSLEAALADELDGTFVQSPPNPAGAAFTATLPELAAGVVTVNVKHKADVASPAISRVYALMQGATVINTRTVNPLPTVATAYSWSTSAPETAAITDRTQLRVRITDTAL